MHYNFKEDYEKGPVLLPISQTNARKTTLNLPDSFKNFSFYSINEGNGYFVIIEGTSGWAIGPSQKGLQAAKDRSILNIKKHSPTASEFQKVIENGIKTAIRKLKEANKKIPSDYGKQVIAPKPAIKKTAAPKPAPQKAAPKITVKKTVTAKTKSEKRSLEADKKRKAMPPGKRIATGGGVYYEYRRNRTDKPGSKI
jgi:hypothetical protein